MKNILLSESPWVMEATSESEQKERIATLFDLNNIRNCNTAALLKLKELQLPDGSWSWYKGMDGSLFVTDFIVEQNARIALLTGSRWREERWICNKQLSVISIKKPCRNIVLSVRQKRLAINQREFHEVH